MVGLSPVVGAELKLVNDATAAGCNITRSNRWKKSQVAGESERDPLTYPLPPSPATGTPRKARTRATRPATGPSYILKHYHATGCAGGAFSFRAASMDSTKELILCNEAREYRSTTLEDIQYSKDDKRRGGGPRVGPFQENIPGNGWKALPKYDFTTKKRSSAFNERMHVEWENHVDHILENGGELPTASVVAKAGFRSCAPCCRDMLALARPTGKTFIMVDLAEDDQRGTFHFVTGDKYLPIPKESCESHEILALKKIVADAQAGMFDSSEAIYNAVVQLGVPLDETAQALYLGDRALLPSGCGFQLKGKPLLEILHAEHFARLSAEYGASIIRDTNRPIAQQQAIQQCRARAKEMLLEAWRPHIQDDNLNLEAYAAAAVAPLLPETSTAYFKMKRSGAVPHSSSTVDTANVAGMVGGMQGVEHNEKRRWRCSAPREQKPQSTHLTFAKLQTVQGVPKAALMISPEMSGYYAALHKNRPDDDAVSIMAASTALPDDGASTELDDNADQFLDWDGPCFDSDDLQ